MKLTLGLPICFVVVVGFVVSVSISVVVLIFLLFVLLFCVGIKHLSEIP